MDDDHHKVIVTNSLSYKLLSKHKPSKIEILINEFEISFENRQKLSLSPSLEKSFFLKRIIILFLLQTCTNNHKHSQTICYQSSKPMSHHQSEREHHNNFYQSYYHTVMECFLVIQTKHHQRNSYLIQLQTCTNFACFIF